MSESFNIDTLFILYENVLKLKIDPDISLSSLGELKLPTAGIIKDAQNVIKRQKLYNRLFYHFSRKCDRYLHFITVSADLLYFVQRYYNNPSNITRLSFTKKFIKLINNATKSVPCHVTIEKSRRHEFVHAHIILYCQKRVLQDVYANLKDSFTNEHKIMQNGKQVAVKISEKDYSNIETGIVYFLGKTKKLQWKPEFVCYSYNFDLITREQILNIIKNEAQKERSFKKAVRDKKKVTKVTFE